MEVEEIRPLGCRVYFNDAVEETISNFVKLLEEHNAGVDMYPHNLILTEENWDKLRKLAGKE